MIWRDAIEKPRVSGLYYCLCQFLDGDIGFSHRVFCLTRNEWQSEIKMIAWLDPEVPEKYLPKKLWESPKSEVEHQAKELEEALEMREQIENKQREKPKVERVFRQLVSSSNFKSDILEVDDSPRLYYSIVKPKRLMPGEVGELLPATPPEPVRYVFKKEEVVLLRVYEEEPPR